MDQATIDRIHAAADFEALRARNFNIMRQAVEDLAVVQTAMNRPVPKLDICTERLEYVIESLQKQIAALAAMK